MMRFFSGNRGITLAALVVTVIILAILTGITITYLSNDNGLIKSAKREREKVEQTTSVTQNEIDELKQGLK